MDAPSQLIFWSVVPYVVKGNSRQMMKWGSDEKHFVTTHLGKYLPDESFVSKKHLLEAK